MTDSSGSFEWRVSTQGYKWTETTGVNQPESGSDNPAPSSHAEQLLEETQAHASRPRWYLTSGYGFTARSYRVKRYYPLQETPSLYEQFARIPLKREAIQEFANQYGALGGDLAEKIRIPPEVSPENRQTTGFGERLSSWKQEISTMNQALTLWEHARDGRNDELSLYIEWTSPDKVIYQSHPDRASRPDHGVRNVIASRRKRPNLLQTLTEGDRILPAIVQIQQFVNSHLSDRVSSQLSRSENPSNLRLQVVPGSLIGAIWFQFARSVSAGETTE